MDRVSRRQFLSRALAAGAGATVLQVVGPGQLLQPTSATAATGPLDDDQDPNFLAGTVLTVDSKTGAITVLDADSQVQTAALDAQSSIWKQGLWNKYSLSTSDCLMGRGSVGPGGLLTLESLWVDIKSFYGTVESLGKSSFVFERSDGVSFPVGVSDLTTLYEQGGPYVGSLGSLEAGVAVRTIGFGDPTLGTFSGTSVWDLSQPVLANSADDETDPVPTPCNPCTSHCPYTYKGLASWFCCGGVNGCGSSGCGGSGGGACNTCRSDRQHMAWPNITNAGGGHCISTCGQGSCSPNNCSSCPTIPRLSCGFSVSLLNPCQSKGTSVVIKDCGPCVHCISSFGCNNRTHVKFDLTPCAFTAIGGSLDSGFVSCDATISLPC